MKIKIKSFIKILIFIFLFIGSGSNVKALTTESSAKCYYKIGAGEFVLTYEKGKLTNNETGGTFVKYSSHVTASNLITSDQKLKCPQVLYWNFTPNSDRSTTYTIYPTDSKAKNTVKLSNEELNNPTESAESAADVFECNYGNFVITTNGVDKIYASATSNNNITLKFNASDFGTSCREGVYYTCDSYQGVSSCIVSINGKHDGVGLLKSYAELSDDDILNADDLSDTQGKGSLIAIDALMAQLEVVKKDLDNENNKGLLYEKFVNARSHCEKVYIDLSKKEGDDEYDKCKKIDDSLEAWITAGYFGNRVISSEITGGCTEILGSLGVWLTRIYNALLLIVPIIIVAFGFKDFIQAMGAGKEDELKKVGSTFIKRLIFGAVFVVLPMLIKFILTIALGGDVANMCIF